MKYSILSALAIACVTTSCAVSPVVPKVSNSHIQVEQPYSRITAPTVKMGAAFMTLKNTGSDRVKLIGGTTPVAKKIEIHRTIIDNQGVMKMREVEGGLELPAGKNVQLKPGGLHIMLIGLKQPLKLGQTFPLTLKFNKGKEKTIVVEVNNGQGNKMNHDMPMAHHHDMPMEHHHMHH